MAVTRVMLMFVDSYEEQSDLGPGVVTTMSFSSDIVDGNTDSKAFTCCHYPLSRGTGVAMSQGILFLGTNAAVGHSIHALDPTLVLDDDTGVTSEFITGRLDPDNRADSNQGRDATLKRFSHLMMIGPSLLDDEDSGTLYWLKDKDPLQSANVVWTEFASDNAGSGSPDGIDRGVYFESGLAHWIHVRGVDTQMTSDAIVCSGFALRYRLVGKGEDMRIP